MTKTRLAMLLGVLLIAPLAAGQVRTKPAPRRALPIQRTPAPPVEAPPVVPPRVSPHETKRLVALYAALPEEEQQQLLAHYEAMGIDLEAIIAATALDEAGITPPQRPLLPLIMRKKFARTPKSVLSARTKLGLEATDRPLEDADSAKVAEWLHLQVMAGEWGELEWFLTERAGDDAEAMYSHIVQSTNSGDPMLLPEEVLSLGNASKEGPTSWQLNVLGQLLKQASSKAATGPMLATIRAGTRLFGGDAPENRARTATLLARAGMAEEAYDYLPPLDMARAVGDADIVLVHALYHADRATAANNTLKEVDKRTAWELFGDITLMEEVDLKMRQEALRAAMALLPEMPEAKAAAWLDEVFASATIAPAALEVVALDAMNLRSGKLSQASKARAIVVMQTAVSRLLDSDKVDRKALRVPLRMLTTGLVAEAEAVLEDRSSRGRTPAGVSMLLRAVPDETWLDAIEPSLAVRVIRAFVGVATLADETDLALGILEEGIAKHPEEMESLAGAFLDVWARRLRPDANSNQTAAVRSMLFAFGGRTAVPAAPLTRGRQARNLNRLERVLELAEERGVDPRTIPNMVGAFRACHTQSETYSVKDIERVFGPIEELPPGIASTLANAMRAGLGGDWRSREVQSRFGMRRNAAEIAQIVAEGYALAIALIDQAITSEPDSWEHAISKAALAYERLAHRKAQSGEDLENYNELRRASFDAFAAAAESYASAAESGRIRPTAAVYLAWFNAAIGATDLSQLTRDNILYEGSERDTQIERIKDSIRAMPAELQDEHYGLMAQALAGAVTSLNPEVKPRVVRHALRVVGDHPQAAPLRRIQSLYDDLIEDEIHLRLTLDGPVAIGADQPFAVVLSLRYTNAVDRETDGFSKYLQNNVWVNLGAGSTWVNYRDRLERSIEQSFGDGFRIEAVSFFESMYPSSSVIERGEHGWQEKPLAYIVLRANDASIERVPPVSMDLDFIDQTGPVILAIESNSPAVDGASEGGARPVRGLVVSQVVDVRTAADGEVTLEIEASGRGVIPELHVLLKGIDAPLDGFVIAEDGVQAHPFGVSDSDPADSTSPFRRIDPNLEEEMVYAGRDEDGVYRKVMTRSWTVRYVQEGNGLVGASFVVPTLVAGLQGEVLNRHFDDLDLVVITGASIPVDGGFGYTAIALGSGVIVLGIVGLAIFSMRRGAREPTRDLLEEMLPARDTPLGAIAALKRIDVAYGGTLGDQQAALEADIAFLEEACFGRDAEANTNGTPREVVDRWVQTVRTFQS
jgi:hypothetical protein